MPTVFVLLLEHYPEFPPLGLVFASAAAKRSLAGTSKFRSRNRGSFFIGFMYMPRIPGVLCSIAPTTWSWTEIRLGYYSPCSHGLLQIADGNG